MNKAAVSMRITRLKKAFEQTDAAPKGQKEDVDNEEGEEMIKTEAKEDTPVSRDQEASAVEAEPTEEI